MEQTTSSPALGPAWEDLRSYMAQPRLVSLDIAPDGQWLAVGVQTPNEKSTDYRTNLWRVPTTGEGPSRQLTRGVEGDALAAMLRDGSLLFTSGRQAPSSDGGSDHDKALWCLPAGGGEAHVVAQRPGGWQSVLSAPEADRLVCGVGIATGLDGLEEDDTLHRRRAEAKVSAILHEGAGVRHWDHDLARQTTRFVTLGVDLDRDDPVDSTSLRLASPELGVGLSASAALSSHGDFLITSHDEPQAGAGRSSHLVRLGLDDGSVERIANDDSSELEDPVLSRDDRLVACTRYERGTPESAPRLYLHLVDLESGRGRDLASDWDRWATPAAFSPDGQILYVTADEDGECPVFAVDIATGSVRRLTQHGAHSQVCLAPEGGALYALRSAWDEPGSVVRIDPATATSSVVYAPVTGADLPGRLERLEARAEDGTRIPGWLVLPDGCDARHPAPLVLWAHGGPLNSWNAWSWRWCPWLLVSQGYAVLLPDPALSTGYGRDFIQRGWGRWGCEPYQDLMAVTDAVVAREDVDAERTAMMGGSFGGYMANWIAGHTDRFRCIVSHASLWNLDSFGPTTDIPWYWGIELGERMMREHSPHRFADQITTPMLVVHGDKDYRVPIGEGLALWWALTSNHPGPPESLPHKFLYFPDENHWVLTPQHATIWYETVRAFLAEHLEGQPFVRSDLL